MATRDELVSRLVLNLYVSVDERRALGGFVSHDEVAQAIERELSRYPRFPVRGDGRSQIVVAPTQTLLVSHRFGRQTVQHFASVRAGVDRYIELEIGPSCGGLRVKP